MILKILKEFLNLKKILLKASCTYFRSKKNGSVGSIAVRIRVKCSRKSFITNTVDYK
jgi:hypothetical protein